MLLEEYKGWKITSEQYGIFIGWNTTETEGYSEGSFATVEEAKEAIDKYEGENNEKS